MLYLVSMNLRDYIVDVPDFPSKGITFRDITPLLADPKAFAFSINKLSQPFKGQKIDVVLGIESRGFIFGAPMAVKLKAGFVPIRKKGKLPREVTSETLVKEYGEDIIEIHKDALKPKDRVLVVDDVLATGGTLSSAFKLIKKSKANLVGIAVLVTLTYLPGEKILMKRLSKKVKLHSIVRY